MPFHIIVATSLVEQQAGRRMFNQDTVHDELDPLVLWVWIASGSRCSDAGQNQKSKQWWDQFGG